MKASQLTPTESMRPLVSVVIAAYRRTAALKCAIDSVRAQSYQEWELIVVHDGRATPELRAVVESFSDARISLVELPFNHGEQSGPNNVGAALARGEYLAFLNHDDIWLCDHLELLVMRSLATGHELSISHIVGVAPTQIALPTLEDLIFYLMPESVCGRIVPYHSIAPASSWLIRTARYRALGGMKAANRCLLEPSQEFLFRAVKRGCVPQLIPEVTVIAVQSGVRPLSYSRNSEPEHLVLQRLVETHLPSELRKTIVARCHSLHRPLWQQRLVSFLNLPTRLWTERARLSAGRGGLLNQLRSVRGLSELAQGITPATIRAAAGLRAPAFFDHEASATARRGSELAPFFEQGWYPQEIAARWSGQRSASLKFSLPSPPEQITLELSVLAPSRLKLLKRLSGRQRLRIWLNDEKVFEKVIKFGGRTVATESVVFSPLSLRVLGPYRLTLEVTRLVRPKQIGLGEDPRRCGVALHAMSVTLKGAVFAERPPAEKLCSQR